MRTLIILVSIVNCIALQVSASVIYVDQNASGSNDGSSWANAYVDLQSALQNSSPSDEIWVADGIYKPTQTTNRNIYFEPPSGVALYGGFSGSETMLSQRDWSQNESRLSGDIGVGGIDDDNSNHVLYYRDVSSNTRLDGFIIERGYTTSGSGAGAWLWDSSVTISNCTFRQNVAASGGAIAHWDGTPPTTGILRIDNCNFSNNLADGATALKLFGIQSFVTNCTIYGNEGGSAVGINYGECFMDRCVLSGNLSDGGAAAIGVGDTPNASIHAYNSLIVGNFSQSSVSAIEIDYFNNHTNEFINCTIAHNRCIEEGALTNSSAIYGNGNIDVLNSIIWGNDGPSDNVQIAFQNVAVNTCLVENGFSNGTGVTTTNPSFVSPGHPLLAPFNATDYDYTLQLTSTAINSGSNSFLHVLFDLDLNSLPRVQDVVVDLGAYETQSTITGLASDLEKIEVQFYPNPTSNRIHIDLGSPIDLVAINTYNALGKLVHTDKRNVTAAIDYILPTQKGVYLIQLVHVDGKITNLKVLKE